MSQLWNINWGFFPLKLQRKLHCRRRAFRHMHTSPLSKLDLTAFHRLFIPRCQATINIFLADHFYSTVNRLLLLGEMGQMWDTSNAEHENGWRKCEKNIFLERRREFFIFFFLLMRRWDVFIGPTSLARPIWTVTGETGCTVGTHLVTKKGSSSWMAPHPDTWTSKSVRTRIWVETMTALLPATVPASQCVHRGSLTRAPCPFTFHGYAAGLYCYLQVVIFQANVNRFIIRLRGAGWYIRIRRIPRTCVCWAAFFSLCWLRNYKTPDLFLKLMCLL